MNTIFNALRIPQANVDSLISGSVIAIISPVFLVKGRVFALYPESEFDSIKIEAWAKCELCQILDKTAPLELLALHTNYSIESIQATLERTEAILLAYLRVYRLQNPIEIKSQAKGNFIPLGNTIYINQQIPTVSDRNFEIQKERLLKLEPPESLLEKIERTLNEAAAQQKLQLEEELAWINRIAEVGNSSGGNEFEKLVRKSFIELGFSNSNKNPKASLDPEATGGAGGIDLCCEKPYSIVGECKASAYQKIPTEVCSQLTYLGQAHYPDYQNAIKIIIAAGSLNYHSNPIAIGNKMNVIRPETLEKLVKLKTVFGGSINLWELKVCLENAPFGEDSNSKLLDFIKNAEDEIELRSHIVQTVKEEQEDNQHLSVTEIRSTYNAKYVKFPQSKLDDLVVKDILIELSSPLAGYLGREKDDKGSDRFYFLRDLEI
jgi:Domain of unknown function (DUF1802)